VIRYQRFESAIWQIVEQEKKIKKQEKEKKEREEYKAQYQQYRKKRDKEIQELPPDKLRLDEISILRNIISWCKEYNGEIYEPSLDNRGSGFFRHYRIGELQMNIQRYIIEQTKGENGKYARADVIGQWYKKNIKFDDMLSINTTALQAEKLLYK
jgi:hypothetical protein